MLHPSKIAPDAIKFGSMYTVLVMRVLVLVTCVLVLVICVLVLVICELVFIVFLYCFFYVYLFLIVTNVRTTATE